jgi:hypothetical protein
MKANGLLKWLVPAILLGIVLIIGKSWVAAPDGQPTHDPENTALAEQAKALGIAGDTPRDTVATLIGQVKAMRSEMQTLKKGNERCRPRTTGCARAKATSTAASRAR